MSNPASQPIVIAGGSGFIGRHLARRLRGRGHPVAILTRSACPADADGVNYAMWDGKTVAEWGALLDGAYAVFNLAGRNVNCRFTPENLQEILNSRVDAITAISQAVMRCKRPPKVWINAGGKDIYGDRGDEVLTEASLPGPGVLTDVCKRWEDAFQTASAPEVRKVFWRIGLVLGEDGVLAVLAQLARAFLGGAAGSGRQYMSWIHRDDMVGQMLWSMDTQAQGVYNGVGPQPVTNADFMHTLRKTLGRPWSPPVPVFALTLGSLALGTEPALILEGNRVLPERALNEGYQFAHPELAPAMETLLR
jgi:uncharacterized protein